MTRRIEARNEVLHCMMCSTPFVRTTYHHKFCSVQCAERSSHSKRRAERTKYAATHAPIAVEAALEAEKQRIAAHEKMNKDSYNAVMFAIGQGPDPGGEFDPPAPELQQPNLKLSKPEKDEADEAEIVADKARKDIEDLSKI